LQSAAWYVQRFNVSIKSVNCHIPGIPDTTVNDVVFRLNKDFWEASLECDDMDATFAHMLLKYENNFPDGEMRLQQPGPPTPPPLTTPKSKQDTKPKVTDSFNYFCPYVIFVCLMSLQCNVRILLASSTCSMSASSPCACALFLRLQRLSYSSCSSSSRREEEDEVQTSL